MNPYKDIIQIIKKERKIQNITGTEMGKVLGMTQVGYSFLETGRRGMSLKHLINICDHLGVEIKLVKTLK